MSKKLERVAGLFANLILNHAKITSGYLDQIEQYDEDGYELTRREKTRRHIEKMENTVHKIKIECM